MTVDRAAVTAIVLAGGRSTRFGGPKLTADLDGATILEHAVRAVAAVAGEVMVAGGPFERSEREKPGERDEFGETPASFDAARVRLLPDEAPFAGPLAAVDGALRVVDTELAIVVGGDMPGLVPEVLGAMLARLAGAPDVDGVVLRDDAARRQVLPVALRVAPARAGAAAALRSGERSLVRFLDRLRCAELPAIEWRTLDPEGRTVLDVDIPGDLDRFGGREIH